jgi:hypothetical protein
VESIRTWPDYLDKAWRHLTIDFPLGQRVDAEVAKWSGRMLGEPAA